MKKILTVALSTAMAFSMFASVAFGDSAVSVQEKYDSLKAKGIFNGYPDQQAHLERDMTRAEFAKVLTKLLGLKEVTGTLSYKDKGYNAKNWAVPYIEAVTAAGIMEGQDKVKQIFNYNGKVTIQEMATALVRALKLEVPANANNSASTWAKGYVQAAIDKGLISKDLNFQANATREQLVNAAYQAEQIINLSVKSYKVADNGKDIEFTLSSGEVVKVTLEKALEPNKETEVKFKNAAGQEITAKVTWVVDAATKVESASANNYKQVVVKFDGNVDKATATNPGNYSITGLTFDDATLSSDNKTVTLTLAQDSGQLAPQKEYTLNVKGVKNSTLAKTFSQQVKFSPVDTTLPEVQEVVGLGTKAFKVVFSEPVKQSSVSSTANFQIDGKAVSGYVKYTYPNVAIISTSLSVGDHTLTVSNVEDYAGFKVLPVTKNFTVAEDKEAPQITGATTNDLYRVELTFNESVKSIGKVYQTSSGKTATYEIKDNKVVATFSEANKLSLAETTIYVEGVTDYSDNSANREIKVTPVLDTVRPTVVGVTAEVYNNNQVFTIDFSKPVNPNDATTAANYTLRDSKGNVVKTNGFTPDGHPVTKPQIVSNSQGKQVKISTLGLLDSGVYTLEINNVRDTASIGNTMLPYSTTVNLGDAAKPAVLGTSYYEVTQPGNDSTFTGLDIIVNYNKAVALDGAGDATESNKYNYSVGTGSTDFKPLPVDTNVIALNADTIRISLPAKQGGYLTQGQPLNLRVANVADTNGNYLEGNVTTQVIQWKNNQSIALESAKATDNETIVAKFNGNLSYVYSGDFVVTVGTSTYAVKNATIDGQNVTFKLDGNKLAADVTGAKFGVKTGITPQSVNANGLKVSGVQDLTDAISPSYIADSATFAKAGTELYTATLTFDEALHVYENPTAFTAKVGGSPVTVKTVKAGANAKEVVVTFEAKGDISGKPFELYLNSDNSSSKFITDIHGNAAKVFSQYVEKLPTL